MDTYLKVFARGTCADGKIIRLFGESLGDYAAKWYGKEIFDYAVEEWNSASGFWQQISKWYIYKAYAQKFFNARLKR